jgi:hypothetical protein
MSALLDAIEWLDELKDDIEDGRVEMGEEQRDVVVGVIDNVVKNLRCVWRSGTPVAWRLHGPVGVNAQYTYAGEVIGALRKIGLWQP